jgi:hypothetical protein
MALTRIIGDIHGKWYDYVNFSLLQGIRHNTETVPERSIQVGDFGIGFYSDYWHEEVSDWMKKNPTHRFIRGNHDDPDKCRGMPGWIEDGSVENDVMYIGGAWSIDHAMRTEGLDWWRDEELSTVELMKLVDRFGQVKPRVMITHDCPTSVAWDMFLSKGLGLDNNKQIKTRTGEALQAMFEIHKPESWYFGHWHHTRCQNILGTNFQCLGELDFIDVNI